MDCDCRKIWTSSSDAFRDELWDDPDIQMDGKRFDETNQRQPFTDRANNYKANRQFQNGTNRQQAIFREGCYYA